MHTVSNYGSFLQAWASQKAIESLGHECEIINYKFPNHWHFNQGVRKKSLKSKIRNRLSFIGLSASQKKYHKINTAVKNHLNLSAPYNNPKSIQSNPPKYDVYVVGSDQTWNPKHMKGDPIFLLSFAPKGANKISMSASVSCSDFENSYKEIFKNHLHSFSSISIRETNSVELISQLSHKPVSVILDPTLLLESQQWDALCAKSSFQCTQDDYIVFYLITHTFNPGKYILNQLKALQKKTNLKILSFTNIPEEYGISSRFVGEVGPKDFLKIFKHASFVVTTSFHGTAFALNFGIPLFSVMKPQTNDDNRQLSLLRSVGAEQCVILDGTNFDDIDPNYDKVKVHNKLSALRIDSFVFLKNSINNTEIHN